MFNKNKSIMRKFLALISCIFGASPKKIIKKNLKTINDFKLDLLKIITIENKVRALVFLFKTISPLQDQKYFQKLIKSLKRKNYGQLNELIESLEIVQTHIDRAGRDKYGLNRTDYGQEVTAESVFLGNVFGLSTKTASFWLERQEVLKKEIREDLSSSNGKKISNWDCVNSQAGNFVNSHAIPLMDELNKIEAYAC